MKRPCLDCGAPTTTGPRCPTHTKLKERQRKLNTGNRYNTDHRRLRQLWATAIETTTVICARCGQPIHTDFDLDHLPDGTSRPSHPTCNRAAH